jgi:hypothetical protein
MAQTIKQKIEAEHGDKIRKLDNHSLYHIIRQEDVHGKKAPLKRWGGKAGFKAVYEIAYAELVKRGNQLPDFSAFFLMCNHD